MCVMCVMGSCCENQFLVVIITTWSIPSSCQQNLLLVPLPFATLPWALFVLATVYCCLSYDQKNIVRSNINVERERERERWDIIISLWHSNRGLWERWSPGYLDFEVYEVVTTRRWLRDWRDALVSQHSLLIWLCSSRNLDFYSRAIKCGHCHRSTENGLWDGHWDIRVNVHAVSLEELVWGHLT